MPLSQPQRERVLSETYSRDLPIEIRASDDEARTVDLAFSSEVPVERWWGKEILDHDTKSVDLGRLNGGGALLLQHDSDRQIGVIESARVDGDRRGRATVRFSRSALGEEVYQDVRDGIRRLVSVGYRVHEMVLESKSEDENTYRVTRWEPLEISIVAVPADSSVGVGRGVIHPSGDYPMPDKAKAAPEIDERQENTPPVTAIQPSKPDEQTRKLETDLERARMDEEIRRVGKHFGFEPLADDYIALGRSLTEFREAVFEAKRAELKPVPIESEQRGRIEIPHRRGRMKAFENTREGEEAAFRAGQWALGVIYGHQPSLRWCKDNGVRVMTGLTSGTAAVVPDELVLPIIDLRERYGIARQRCYIHPMGTDTATVPRRKSGVTAYFVGREEATTPSDMSFDDVNLVAREVAALTRLAKSFVADAAIELGDKLADEMAYAFAVKEDACLFNGDGTSTYGGIVGIRPKIIDGTHTVGAVDAASGHDTFAEIDHDDLVSLTGVLPEFPGIMPAWYISKRGNALVFDALKTAAGGNTGADLSRGIQRSYLGDEIVISQSMPSVVTDLSNVAMLIYGDLRMGVTFGDRAGFEVEVLRERYAEYRQIGIQAVERFDIVVHGLGDTSNAGPIVALIGE